TGLCLPARESHVLHSCQAFNVLMLALRNRPIQSFATAECGFQPCFDAPTVKVPFDPRRHFATEPPLPLCRWFQWLRRVVHATRFDIGAALQAFQTGDLFALFADRLFQSSDFAKQLNQQSFKLWTT